MLLPPLHKKKKKRDRMRIEEDQEWRILKSATCGLDDLLLQLFTYRGMEFLGGKGDNKKAIKMGDLFM